MNMSDDLSRRILETVDTAVEKLDDLRERTTRVEEQSRAAERAREHSRNGAEMSMIGLTKQVSDLRQETQTGLAKIGDDYSRLDIRVIKVEDAQKILNDQVSSAALRGGGFGGLIITAVTGAIAVISWLAGWLHLAPPK